MDNSKGNNCGTLYGVGCNVTSCRYNGADCCCHADNISVESKNAMKKGETFCSTFVPRTN